MKELGKVIEIHDNTAKVLIERSTACGNCGACQVGKDGLNMILFADNNINANIGDIVEIDLKTSNFLLATAIAYGLPLLGLMLGTIGSYYLMLLLGFKQPNTQGISAIIGLIFLVLTFLIIRANEHRISKLNQFKPIIVSVNDNNK